MDISTRFVTTIACYNNSRFRPLALSNIYIISKIKNKYLPVSKKLESSKLIGEKLTKLLKDNQIQPKEWARSITNATAILAVIEQSLSQGLKLIRYNLIKKRLKGLKVEEVERKK